VNLTWETPSNDGGSPITSYNVYRGTSSGSLEFLVRVLNSLEYLDNDIVSGTTYYYAVSAINNIGMGPQSEAVTTTIPSTTTTSETTNSFSAIIVLLSIIGIIRYNNRGKK
jgi:titin